MKIYGRVIVTLAFIVGFIEPAEAPLERLFPLKDRSTFRAFLRKHLEFMLLLAEDQRLIDMQIARINMRIDELNKLAAQGLKVDKAIKECEQMLNQLQSKR